jgi:hypothetical protein
MKLRKILSVLLCVGVVVSVMAVVAVAQGRAQYGAAAPQQAAASPPPASTEPTTAAPTTTTQGFIERLSEFWVGFYPDFDTSWRAGFVVFTQLLYRGFVYLLELVGLNIWSGGSFNIF